MDYYKQIKNELINNEVNRKVKNYSINRSDLETYYNVGKTLSEAGKHYGENVIGSYADRLKIELNKKYNERTLRRYRQFYLFATKLKWSAMPTKLSWSHVTELMVLSDENAINYYISVVYNRNIGYRELGKLIKNHDYDRIEKKAKNKMEQNEILEIGDLIKNPIQIRNTSDHESISEKILQKLILEDISNFMKELGEGYSFIDNEYKIKIGNRYNYIDLLFFNYIFNSFVIVELKITDLKKEHIGQIEVYMNYIDNNLKNINNDETIGIIICRKDNKFIMEYCSDKRILSREYELL